MRSILLLLLLLPALAFSQQKVLFDYTLNETAGNADWIIDTQMPVPSPAQSGITSSTSESFWLGGISAWGVALAKLGFTVHTLTTTYGITYGNSSNPYDLSNYKIFVICEPQNQFTAAEKSAILSFVQNGGGLMMVGDHTGADRDNDGWDPPEIWNDLGSGTYFGIHFQSTSESYNNIVENSSNLATSPTDSIIHGAAGTVTSLYYHAGAAMTMETANNATAAGHIWMNAASRGTTRVVAATARYGAGKVAAVGDSSPADDGTGQSGNTLYVGWDDPLATNDIVLLNMCLWLAASSGASAPAAPALLTPANAATGQSSPVTARWNASSGATGYQLDVSTSNAFSSLFLTDSTLVDTTRSVGGLSLGTTYYWRVRAKNAAGWGSFSATRSFTTLNVPSAPSLLAPANLAPAVASPATLRWSKPATAAGYQVDVSTSNTFSALFLTDSTLVDTTRSVGGLSLGTTYYWRARAKNAAGWGAFSGTYSFVSWDVPPPPVSLSPADGDTGLTNPVAFRWTAPPGAASYQIDVSLAPSFSPVAASDSALADTAALIGGLSHDSTYHWRVRARNGAGWGAYAAAGAFRMMAVPPTPELLEPPVAPAIYASPFTIRWRGVPNADRYRVVVTAAHGAGPVVVLDDSTSADTLAMSPSLDPGDSIVVRVWAHNAAGWGLPCDPRAGTVWSDPVGPVQVIAPGAGAVDVPLPTTVRWHGVPNGVLYSVVIELDNPSPSIVFADSALTDTVVVVPGLAPATLYRARVGVRSPSAWMTPTDVPFTTWSLPETPALLSPDDGADGLTSPVTLRWTAAHGAVAYDIAVATDSAFTQIVLRDSSLTDTSAVVLAADSTATHHWRVRAKGAAGWGAFASAWTFRLRHLAGVAGEFTARWNLVSVPVGLADLSVASVFPSAVSPAYAFENAYAAHDTLAYGAGYWIKFPAAFADTVVGVARLEDTVAVHAGWNLVGMISANVDAASITSIPGGIVASPFYGYANGYAASPTLLPFRAYWVKCSADGLLILR